MTYQGQHSGKGKVHFINDDFDVLCGNKASLDFTTAYKYSVENGKLFETFRTSDDEIMTKHEIKYPIEFCSKCLKKIGYEKDKD